MLDKMHPLFNMNDWVLKYVATEGEGGAKDLKGLNQSTKVATEFWYTVVYFILTDHDRIKSSGYGRVGIPA